LVSDKDKASNYRNFESAGIGSVAPKIDEFKIDDILPSAGFGLRFLASEDYRVNVGIDYAFGEDSEALYFRIGEAF